LQNVHRNLHTYKRSTLMVRPSKCDPECNRVNSCFWIEAFTLEKNDSLSVPFYYFVVCSSRYWKENEINVDQLSVTESHLQLFYYSLYALLDNLWTFKIFILCQFIWKSDFTAISYLRYDNCHVLLKNICCIQCLDWVTFCF